MIVVDGVYVTEGSSAPVFRAASSPGAGALQALVQWLAKGIGRLLEKRGLIAHDAEHGWLSGEPVQAGSLDELIGHCISWRIAVGLRAGQKVFTLQTGGIATTIFHPLGTARTGRTDDPMEKTSTCRGLTSRASLGTATARNLQCPVRSPAVRQRRRPPCAALRP
jgi:hypothetical protein